MTGRTYHAANIPPYPLPANKTRTVLRTQSHKADGFNELRFEDEAGEEQIWLHAQKNLDLLTLNDRITDIDRDAPCPPLRSPYPRSYISRNAPIAKRRRW